MNEDICATDSAIKYNFLWIQGSEVFPSSLDSSRVVNEAPRRGPAPLLEKLRVSSLVLRKSFPSIPSLDGALRRLEVGHIVVPHA